MASYVATFQVECDALGVTLGPEKNEGLGTKLVFLGIGIDTVKGLLTLPGDKLAQLQEELSKWDGKCLCRRRELESLVGILQHAAKVIRPGHTFVWCMIDLLIKDLLKDPNISFN